jgi:hypothetical protein
MPYRIRLTVFGLLASSLAASACGANAAATNNPTPVAGADPVGCLPAPGESVSIATAKLIVEYNATDNDIGVHGAFDDHGWSELCVYDPNGTLVLAVRPQGQLQDLTMAGIFFESREPPGSEFSFADLKATFPEGQYQVRANSLDGTALNGAAMFTHDVPAPPVISSPGLVDDEANVGDTVLSTTDLVIAWEDVTATVDGGPVVISGTVGFFKTE